MVYVHRAATWGAVIALSGFMGSSVAIGQEQPREWRFEAFLGDRSIGEHDFMLRENSGGTRELETNARFDVKVLFIDAYSYRHDNVELWQGDCLQSIRSRTDDNGDELTVDGARESAGFVVRTNAGTKTLPACVMSFAYWNPKILQQTQLLNPQTGDFVDVMVTPEGEESLRIGDKDLPARRYRLESRNMTIWLWYSRQDDWLGLRSTTKSGRMLDYRLRAGSTATGLAAAR